MADEGSSTPRRALGPLPDEPGEARVGGRFGSRALPEAPSPTSPTPAGSGRGGRFAKSPLSPEDPLDVEGTTPVPPPMPVLPDSEAGLAPATGRRYSASMEPGEVSTAAPRRSAVSANSPTSAIEPILPPVVRPTAPPPVTVPAPTLPPPPISAALGNAARKPGVINRLPESATTAPTAPADAPTIRPPVTRRPSANTPRSTVEPSFYSRSAPVSEPTTPVEPEAAPGKVGKAAKPPRQPREKRLRAAAAETPPVDDAPVKARSAKPALIVISAVAAVAVLVAATVWLLTMRSVAPSGGPSASGTAVALDPLLTTADLAGFGGVTWAEPVANSDGVRPLCLPAQSDGLPVAQRSDLRKTPATSSETDAVVQVVDSYADVAAATQAYAARLVQLGTCTDDVVLITGANTITGLADSAEVVRLTVQEQTDQFHSVLVSRTGRSVSIVDVGTSAAVTASDLANVTARALSRQCGGELGACPGIISVANTLPPPGSPGGWLVPADLPRVTAGAGRWGATEPKAALNVVGSQCEALNLKTVTGTQSAAQRTLLLADDVNAPDGFGVDQVVYTFADAAGADTLAKKLDKNLTGCPDRAPTATVKDGPGVKGTGAAGVKISGSTYLVTQKTETDTVMFRVAVLTVDKRMVYLLANPSTAFDFADADWAKLAVRSGQRTSQSS